ncbi:MAG: malic enzyme [Alphaproteobacteria bacterium]|jgi:malate dehydrogenase (oxaloacetate-decarboxylating)(NADP+)|nr:malic enzyme [Alphaproteobacteria bacterium]
MKPDIYKDSLDYHRYPTPGKLSIHPTKPLADQRDLALAYSPGVAAASRAIAESPSEAATLTARSNLIAVISNGTAVLGLGNIGPLAAKPVMEGKAVLFKKFAGIDVFDLEINENDPDKLVDMIAALEPTFGGINLEDIKAPECFYIEKKLHERMKIPVFHDDQHGTAIIVAAAVLNGLKLVNKDISQIRLVTSGAGAAALACVDLLVALGLSPQNVILCDSTGVVHYGREDPMDDSKRRYAVDTPHRSLAEALKGADIFLGLSIGNVVTKDMVMTMAPSPLILALANPDPEILPEIAREARPDAIIATGRTDYPNQVNNVLCFPFIFRGALDVGATTINQEMKIACVKAIANLAQAEGSDVAISAYGGEMHSFGPTYIIPKPFDPRLILEIAPAVAKAAMDTGIATRPIADIEAYRQKMSEYVYRSAMVMKPLFQQAKANPKRVTFVEGEDMRVLRATQILVDEGIAKPILIGRPLVIEKRLNRLSLRLKEGIDFEIIDPNNDSRYDHYWHAYHALTERKGISPDVARILTRTSPTLIGSLTVHLGDADTMICGAIGRYHIHLEHIRQIFGFDQENRKDLAALGVLIREDGVLFICDPYVNPDPSVEQICQMTLMAAAQVRRFGITPKAALLSYSSFGAGITESACKMRQATAWLHQNAPDLEVEGEMHADAALSETIRQQIFPNSKLQGQANLLIMPGIDAANIAFNMAKSLWNALTVGPILMGCPKPVHIVTPSVSPRGLVNMAALAVVDAGVKGREERI